MTANKFINYYLPLGLAVLLLVVSGFAYLALTPKTAKAANSIVQTVVNHQPFDFGSGISTTFGSAVTPGNLLVIAIDSSTAIIGVSDPTNGNWTQDSACHRQYDTAGNSFW